jgi:lysozyme family protein
MANINLAINFVLRQEDAKLTGVITDTTSDSGGRTRFGVAEKYHPDLTKTGFYDNMDFSDALEIADSVYKNQYAVPLQISNINSQDIANALLSFGVNIGTSTIIGIVQEVCGVAQDGVVGPKTLAAINKANPTTFLSFLAKRIRIYYADLVSINLSQSRFLAGWLNRVNQNCLVV